MQKRVILASISLVLIVLVSSSFAIAANSVEQEIQRLAHYAQEYEIGNINYAQFSVYLASVQEHLNEAMGASQRDHEDILKAAQLESALGPPTEKARWVWVEKEDREMRFDTDVPAWRNVVFDGSKVQIRLNAWPHLRYAEEKEVRYRLHTEIVFKKPQETFDPKAAISAIHQRAEAFNAAPTRENAETLARESVLVERKFSELIERSPLQCENTITSLLGPTVQRREQKTLRKEITLYEGKNYEGMLMLESCEECEWPWININVFVNTHGRNYPGEPSSSLDQHAREAYKGYTQEQFKEEIRRTVDAMRVAL